MWAYVSQVSWIRRRDSHILTIDWLLFIADDRFRIFLVEPTCTWTLQIKYVQPRDAGIYECQINTSPKMSHLVQLNVVGKFQVKLKKKIFNILTFILYYIIMRMSFKIIFKPRNLWMFRNKDLY